MCPNDNGPPTFEDRLAALEQQVAGLQADLGVLHGDFEKNNLNITTSLQVLIDALIAMKVEHCELPPGC